MRKITNNFLSLLFNSGEEICFSPNKYAYPSKPQDQLDEDSTVFVAINPIKGQRNDSNVTAYRSFLVELDDSSLADQKYYIDSMGFPYNYCVYSGGKSLHFLCTLKNDLPSEKIYRFVYQWILNILKRADQQLKSPSRCVRFPQAIRPETGKTQDLIYISNERIDNDRLESWLNSWPSERPIINTKKKIKKDPDMYSLPDWCKEKLINGVHNQEGARNQTWMSIGCEFGLNGYTLEDTVAILENYFVEQSDFGEKEFVTAITSGHGYAQRM